MRIELRIIFFVITAISFTVPAFSEDNVTEIVVHASPLSEKQRDLAGSASVYQPDSLLNPSKPEFSQVITDTPNFSWSGGTSSPRFLQIRGIGELEQYEGAPNPSVGLIFDDFDLSGIGLPTTLFDVEQVEVLRGPQATRFGANGLAGVVALRSSEPTPYDTSRGALSIGSDDLLSGGVAFGGKVASSEEVQYRFSISSEQSDGFRKDLFLNKEDTNQRERWNTRLQLRYLPSTDTKIDVGLLYANQNDGYDAFALNNAFTTQSDRPGKDQHELAGLKLAAENKLDSSTIVQSISALSSSKLDYGFDGDWGNNEFWGENAPYDYRSSSARDRDVFSQEFRLASAESEKGSWLLGLFGQHLKEESQIDEFSEEVVYDTLSSNYQANSFAGFAAVEESVTDKVSLGATLRAERRDTRYSDSNSLSFNPDFDMFGGSSYAKYRLNESDQLYTLVSRGFKGGGFNAGTRVPLDRIEYGEETLWNYEVGIKGSCLNERVSYDISTFWMQRNDQQIKLSLQDDPSDPLSFTYLNDNAGRGRNIGAEASVNASITETLMLGLSAGLLETEITSVDPALSNLQGRAQSSAAPWNYALRARYLLSDTWYLSSSLSGQDSFYFDDSHDQKSDPYHLLSAEIGWLQDSLRVAVWVKNLTDENYAVRGFYFGNEPPDFPNKEYIQRGDPMSFGITVSYLF